MAPSNVPPGVCRWFNTPGGCNYGDGCKFAHERVSPTEDTSTEQSGPAPPRRREWSELISHPGAFRPPMLERAIREGLATVESGKPDSIQALIIIMGSEKGLQWVTKVLEGRYYLDQVDETSYRLQEHCVPFLKLISHEHILSSLALENIVGAIYNVIGNHGAHFFSKVVAILKDVVYDSASAELMQLEEAFLAVSATLFSTINLNQDASIQGGYREIAISLSNYLDKFPPDRRQSFALRSTTRYLQRIKERLALGESIPGATHQIATTTAYPELQFKLDMPGNLSLKGPRHDNDHASIERISILPTTGELKADRPEFLPIKYKDSPHHETGIQRLLDSQFRLLREDTSGQLRDAIRGLATNWEHLVYSSDKNLKRKILRKIDIKISLFNHVTVQKLKYNSDGLTADVVFAQPVDMSGTDQKTRTEWWEESRNLQWGSIVALVDETRETSFFLVADRTVNAAIREVISDDSDSDPMEDFGVKDLAGDRKYALITLRLVNPISAIDQARLMTLAAPSSAESTVMVEFPGLLFASFAPILRGLQSLHERPNMPFTDWLAPSPESGLTIRDGLVEVPPPLYLSKKGVALDLTPITHDGFSLSHSIDQPVTTEGLEAHTTLDRGQCQGFISSLQHELAMVQGPPGTGKSYVGDKVVQILLANRCRLSIGPIICVCVSTSPSVRLKQAVTE